MNKLFEHICAFEKKNGTASGSVEQSHPDPFSRILQPGWWNFLIFIPPTMLHVFRSYTVSSQAGFHSSDEIKVKLSAHPFHLVVDDSPDDCQMELIEVQADMDTKWGYS